MLLWEPRRTGCSSRIMQTKQLFRAKAWIWQQDLQILMNFLQITNEQCWKSKFGATAFMTVGRLKDITMIVTDEKPEMKWLKEFKKLGIECIYPE